MEMGLVKTLIGVVVLAAGFWAMILILRTIRRSISASIQSKKPPREFEGDGSYDYDIVGESSYQDAISRIVGGSTDESVEHECYAIVAPEPSNKHDKNAIKVIIDGTIVGYIPRSETDHFHPILAGRPAGCEALIVGGWNRGRRGRGHFGVKLDIEWPPTIAK